MSRTSVQYHHIPLEKRIKPILDRIHIVRDLINRAEYEEKRHSFGEGEDCEKALYIKELPPIQSDLKTECLRKNLKPIVFIIGGPGPESKDLAKTIIRKYDLTLISVGELIKKEIKERTNIGQFMAATVRKGNLVQSDIVVWLLKREMLHQFRRSKGYLIEGFPRTQKQLLHFEYEVARAHIVLFLCVDNSSMEDMLLSPDMIDEKRENLLHRICNYQKYTDVLRNEFGKRGKLIRGGGSTAWKLIDEALAKVMLKWCFLRKDVTGIQDLSAPYVRGERVFEIIGGIVPYFVQWDNC